MLGSGRRLIIISDKTLYICVWEFGLVVIFELSEIVAQWPHMSSRLIIIFCWIWNTFGTYTYSS